MPAKRSGGQSRVEKRASQAEGDEPRNATSSESIANLGTKEFFAIEDAVADRTTAAEDCETFTQTAHKLSALLTKYHAAAKQKLDAESQLTMQVEILSVVMKLRRINRLSQFRNKKARDHVAEDRQKVEEQYLQLQNLLYEVSHIEKEVEKCLEFKSDHEDIEMVTVDQFYKEAPQSISKPDATQHDNHSQRLARLAWELETRKKLEADIEHLENKKAGFLKQIEDTREQLETIQPKLDAVIEASRPLQDALDMNYEKEALQREYAKHLPSALYYLYIHAVAYKEVFDKKLQISIEGDLDAVKRIESEKLIVGQKDEEDSEDSDDENGKNVDSQEQNKHSKTRRATITEPDEFHADFLENFPLFVEIKTTYQGKATIALQFFYIDFLGVISVKSRLELVADLPRAVASANDLLSDDTMLAWLFPSDSGLRCPNPAGATKLDHCKIDFEAKTKVIGRMYEWAQKLGGLRFPSLLAAILEDDEEGCIVKDQVFGEGESASEDQDQQADNRHLFQSILQRIRRRVLARLGLQEQFAAFETLNVHPPKAVSSWFPARICSKIIQWSSMTYDDFMCHPASQDVRKFVNEEYWFCNVVVERGSAKLTALVYIHADYPRSAPVFCLLLNWRGSVSNVQRSTDLWHLSRAVNVECVQRIPKSCADFTLAIQLQFLISRLDVLLEIQSTEQEVNEFSLDHLYLQTRKYSRLPATKEMLASGFTGAKLVVGSVLCRSSFAGSRSFHATRLLNDDDDKKRKGGQDDGGWFTRILGGGKSIEPMKGAHSSLLADKDMVYELKTHDVHPGAMDDYQASYGNYVQLLKKKNVPTDLVGSWTVMIGNQDQAVHIFRYREGFTGADKTINMVMSDQELQTARKDHAKLCGKRRNCIMLAFSFWGDPKPRPPKHVYELRSYVLKAGTMIEWGNNWAKGINYRRDFNQDVAGFFSQIGRLYMVFHLWAYDDLVSRKRIREETWRKPGWDTNVAYTVPLIKKMDSKLLIPSKYSPLQ